MFVQNMVAIVYVHIVEDLCKRQIIKKGSNESHSFYLNPLNNRFDFSSKWLNSCTIWSSYSWLLVSMEYGWRSGEGNVSIGVIVAIFHESRKEIFKQILSEWLFNGRKEKAIRHSLDYISHKKKPINSHANICILAKL